MIKSIERLHTPGWRSIVYRGFYIKRVLPTLLEAFHPTLGTTFTQCILHNNYKDAIHDLETKINTFLQTWGYEE